MKLSKEKCDQVNAIERDKALAWVERNIKVPLTEPQKAGIASFCPYNVAYQVSVSRQHFMASNAGDRKGACEAIRWWIKDGGRDCRVRSNNCYGQVIRRDQESALTCWGIDSESDIHGDFSRVVRIYRRKCLERQRMAKKMGGT
ncbi:glycoside hydrolase family protein [Escherichia coli]